MVPSRGKIFVKDKSFGEIWFKIFRLGLAPLTGNNQGNQMFPLRSNRHRRDFIS